ncbi:MAG: DMT family transporter [Anaerovoracaceae bacterium]
MTKQLKADIMLFIITFLWGISYYLMDVSMRELSPFTLNANRFIIAFLVAVILAFPKLKGVSFETIKYSFFVGTILVFVYLGATYGVKYTSLSNAGFLCALSVVFTPIFGYAIFKIKPERKLVFVVIMCLIGIGLLSLDKNLKPALGDFFCLICAVAYAFDLLITEKAVRKPEVNAFQLGVFQLGFSGLWQLLLAFILEEPALPKSKSVWMSVLFLAVFCTGVSFVVQAIAQQYTTATHVGIIFTLEPVFAGLVAFFLAHEILLPRAYFGAVLLIAGCFIMEIKVNPETKIFKKLLYKKRKEKNDG